MGVTGEAFEVLAFLLVDEPRAAGVVGGGTLLDDDLGVVGVLEEIASDTVPYMQRQTYVCLYTGITTST